MYSPRYRYYQSMAVWVCIRVIPVLVPTAPPLPPVPHPPYGTVSPMGVPGSGIPWDGGGTGALGGDPVPGPGGSVHTVSGWGVLMVV